MSKRLTLILLSLIFLLAVFLRFYQLTKVPPSLNWDEVSYGYNAYSILATGRDEFGKVPVFNFRSLDDFKMPVQLYLIVASEKILGFGDFAVRFPSAFLGSLTVILVFLLSRELFKDDRIAVLGSVIVAILPWNVQFSRMASEANIALFFLGLGALFFLWGLRRNPFFLALSALFFGLSQYTYLSFRVLSPLIAFFLIFLYAKELLIVWRRNKTKVFLAALVLSAFLVFVVRDSLSYAGQVRFTGTSVFNVPDAYVRNEKEMFVDAKLGINLTRRFFHDSKFFTSFELVARGYLAHFSPDFLFFDLGQKHHHAPRFGLLYLWMLAFILSGLYFLFASQKKKPAIFLTGWLVFAPVPASVTWDIPHAIRAVGMTIPLILIAAFGIVKAAEMLKRQKQAIFYLSLVFFAIISVISFYYFYHQYFVHLPNERADKWQYGRKETIEYLEKHKDEYDKAVVSTKLEWPHIFFLYYSAYDPRKYLEEGGTKSGYYASQDNKFGKYEFREFNIEEERAGNTTLYVGFPGQVAGRVEPVKIINYPDGSPAIYIVKGVSPSSKI